MFCDLIGAHREWKWDNPQTCDEGTCRVRHVVLVSIKPAYSGQEFIFRLYSFIMSEIDAQSLYMHRKHVGLKDLYGEAPVAVESARVYFLKQIAVRILSVI